MQSKLKNLRNQLTSWNRTTFGNVTKEREELLQKIQELDKQEALAGLSEEFRSQIDSNSKRNSRS